MKLAIGCEVKDAAGNIGRIVTHLGSTRYRVRFAINDWPFPTDKFCDLLELTITNKTDRDLSEQYEEALL